MPVRQGQQPRQQRPAGARVAKVRPSDNEHPLLALQRTAGNRAVQRLLAAPSSRPNPSNGDAPVQRCAIDPNCPNPAHLPCPQHPAPYSQHTDPSMNRFFRPGENFVGGNAMNQQYQGNLPPRNHIRVPAQNGFGLHEILPTDQNQNVMQDAAAGGFAPSIQSGGRTSTGRQMMMPPGGNAGGHANFFVGNAATNGQSVAHDVLRQPQQPAPNPLDQALTQHARHLSVTPHGQQVMASPTIGGETPNALGGAVEPPGAGANRIKLAQHMHDIREAQKDRHVQVANAYGRPSQVSPQRTSIDANGGGGGYMQQNNARQRSVAPPIEGDPNNAPNQRSFIANVTSYLTGPGRFGYQSGRPGKHCQNCQTDSPWTEVRCQNCGHPI